MERKILLPMKKIIIFLTTIITLISCDYTEFLDLAEVQIEFDYSWNNELLTYNNLNYTTENGDTISIENIKYVISKIQLKSNNNFVHNIHHQLIKSNNNTKIHFNKIPSGLYALTFVFGLKNEDNITNSYDDLNTENFNVDSNFGGGYYFMKLRGKFKNNNQTEQDYNFNTIRAVDTTNPLNLTFQDTSFDVQMDSLRIHPEYGTTNIHIHVNIAKWFKNPNTWDIQTHNQQLENDFNAQIKMHENGQNVFSLRSVNN